MWVIYSVWVCKYHVNDIRCEYVNMQMWVARCEYVHIMQILSIHTDPGGFDSCWCVFYVRQTHMCARFRNNEETWPS